MQTTSFHLLFATHNPGKLREVRLMCEGTLLHVLGLEDIGFCDKIPETHDTLEANAAEKAEFVHRAAGSVCFAEDTGLFVNALGGAPGVHSARYAGNAGNAEENIKKLLLRLQGIKNREAVFVAVIAFVSGEGMQLFKGNMHGLIAEAPAGETGFGYDPVFIPSGYSCTLAELPAAEKNQFSHRSIAFRLMLEFLEKNHILHAP